MSNPIGPSTIINPAPRCTGFGLMEGRCNNPAGTPWSPHWCATCNRELLAHIARKIQEIRKEYAA